MLIRDPVHGDIALTAAESAALDFPEVQRLRGIKQLGSNGVLVGDSALSSTTDYGFAIDAIGNAVIAYRDDGNVSGGAVHTKVQKVDPAGNLLWGSTGVQVDAAG
jgi:hypothetical protein